MKKVYVSQESNLDFRPARQFGEVVFLTRADEDFTNNGRSPVNDELVERLRKGLAHYDGETDYVVLTGSPYINAMVMFILGMRGETRVCFLRWSNRDREYIPMPIDLI